MLYEVLTCAVQSCINSLHKHFWDSGDSIIILEGQSGICMSSTRTLLHFDSYLLFFLSIPLLPTPPLSPLSPILSPHSPSLSSPLSLPLPSPFLSSLSLSPFPLFPPSLCGGGGRPTLPELLCLEIPQRVGVHYITFGVLLLNDQTGSRVMALKKECQGVAEDVLLRILQEWLEGKGLPVTWQTLIQTLRNTKLSVLADEIQAAKL